MSRQTARYTQTDKILLPVAKTFVTLGILSVGWLAMLFFCIEIVPMIAV